MVIAIDNFFGCYLLYCLNSKYKGRTYIGFTVNPERRIHQHNSGKHKGGAWKTSGKGPWEMVLVIHGFPSDIAALRFEWAWQNPVRSRRLKHVAPKSRKESHFQYRVRIASAMLCQTPWKKLPLTVRWLKQEYAMDLDPFPPNHMPIAFGPVTAKVKKHKVPIDCIGQTQAISENYEKTSCNFVRGIVDSDVEENSDTDDVTEGYKPLIERLSAKVETKTTVQEISESPESAVCYLCKSSIMNEKSLACPSNCCKMTSHLTCLAQHFLSSDTSFQLLPVEGSCPSCDSLLLWGELIQISQGFHQYLKT